MSPTEITAIAALNRCTFLPGSWDKRFVRALKQLAEQQPEKELTPKQQEWLKKLEHKYRKQISNLHKISYLAPIPSSNQSDRASP